MLPVALSLYFRVSLLSSVFLKCSEGSLERFKRQAESGRSLNWRAPWPPGRFPTIFVILSNHHISAAIDRVDPPKPSNLQVFWLYDRYHE
ncbi:hypothetical protein K435DRAFT_727816, partial [Dendrothele bispora CBS 962.96]